VFGLLGVFAAGRIINAKTGRSQLLGGMTWGLSMALHEHSALDPRFGPPTRSIPVRPVETLENEHQRP
jgi:CO/xanthine dehydrogenase Mo-binding subunit